MIFNSAADEMAYQIKEVPNTMVPWYLILSYAYYHKHMSLVPDQVFDRLCRDLLAAYPSITHRHKALVDLGSLQAGTAFNLSDEDYPSMAKGACMQIIQKYNQP